MVPARDPMLRILDRLVVDQETNCWLFTGYRRGGYGRVGDRGKQEDVHRIVFKRVRGPIPEGYEPHHVCERRSCCNPWHLELLTTREHVRLHLFKGRRAFCRHGHEMTDENTQICNYNGSTEWRCRTCQRERSRLQRLKRRNNDDKR